MKWSARVGSFAGIPVRVHVTFLVLLAWIAVSHVARGDGVGGALAGVGFVLALFSCVVLHEFGHALVARHFQIRTRDITLLPIGGVARLERMPQEPLQEFLVAIAGPAVNVVLAAALFGILFVVGMPLGIEQVDVLEGSFLVRLLLVNVALVVFNLIPAFPMDGGRVLRALLAARMPFVEATQVAAAVGQTFALLFGLAGLFFNPFLVLIALFVWIGAAGEASIVSLRAALSGIPVRAAMITKFDCVAPSDPLSHAIALTVHGTQKDFPVVDGGRVVGMLRGKDLAIAAGKGDSDQTVGEVMQGDPLFAHEMEMLEVVFARLGESDGSAIAVTRAGELVGLLTMEHIGEFLTLRRGLRGTAAAAPLDRRNVY